MDVQDRLKIMELEDEIRRMHLGFSGLKQAISCAVCANCGDVIGDEDWEINDSDLLVHARCMEES